MLRIYIAVPYHAYPGKFGKRKTEQLKKLNMSRTPRRTCHDVRFRAYHTRWYFGALASADSYYGYAQ